MTFKIKIQEVTIEEVRNGRNKYDKASVVYSFNGENRTQNLMSFSNPAVFAKVKALKPGEEVVVTVTKNDKGYNQWAAVEPVGNTKDEPKSASATTGRVSNYETAEERAKRQVLIVKQSCLAQAVAFVDPDEDTNVQHVLDVAQQFVDWVMADDSQALDGEDPTISQE